MNKVEIGKTSWIGLSSKRTFTTNAERRYNMNSAQINPKFVIAKAYVNGDGEVIRFVRADGTDHEDEDYGDEKERTIPGNAFLITENYCRWKLIDGKWRCV